MPDPRKWITTILYYTSTEEIDSLNFITIIENLFNDQVNKRILKTQKTNACYMYHFLNNYDIILH